MYDCLMEISFEYVSSRGVLFDFGAMPTISLGGCLLSNREASTTFTNEDPPIECNPLS